MKTLNTLKSIVKNEYFPGGGGAVRSGHFLDPRTVGGLSLLSSSQTPLTTIAWLLFVYSAAVLSPLAGVLAATDLIRRWRRNRQARGGLPGVRRPPRRAPAGPAPVPIRTGRGRPYRAGPPRRPRWKSR